MTPKGVHLKIKPKPKEKVLKSGIILPDTVTPQGHTWGEVIEANDYLENSKGEKIKVGARVLFFGESKSIINNRQVLYWEYE